VAKTELNTLALLEEPLDGGQENVRILCSGGGGGNRTRVCRSRRLSEALGRQGFPRCRVAACTWFALILHLSDPSRVDGGLTHSTWRSAESPGRECEISEVGSSSPGGVSRVSRRVPRAKLRLGDSSANGGTLKAVSAEHVLTPPASTRPGSTTGPRGSSTACQPESTEAGP